LPLNSNTDFQKYTQILDANLWPFVAEDFLANLTYSRTTCTGTLLTSFHGCWQDAQLSLRDRTAEWVIVLAKSSRLELGEYFTNIIALSSTTVI